MKLRFFTVLFCFSCPMTQIPLVGDDSVSMTICRRFGSRDVGRVQSILTRYLNILDGNNDRRLALELSLC